MKYTEQKQIIDQIFIFCISRTCIFNIVQHFTFQEQENCFYYVIIFFYSKILKIIKQIQNLFESNIRI